MPAVTENPEWPHAATLRGIAKAIEPVVPYAAEALRRIAREAETEDLARAWDEGAEAVELDLFAEEFLVPPNPYRRDTPDAEG